MATPSTPHQTSRSVPVSSSKHIPAKRKRSFPYSQPRFKLHTPPNLRLEIISDSIKDDDDHDPCATLTSPLVPSIISSPPTEPKHSLDAATDSSTLPILALHQPNLPNFPPPTPVIHISCTDTIIACSSPTQLTVWALSPAYPSEIPSPTSTPYAHLLSSYPCPSDHAITGLAITPDSTALALAIQATESALSMPTTAILLLNPQTAKRYLRLALPDALNFQPTLPTGLQSGLSLAFVTASNTRSLSQHPSLSRDSELPHHLRSVFSQYAAASSVAPTRAGMNQSAPAPYALAVAGSNGVTAHYRFTSAYTRVFQYTVLHPPDLFQSSTGLRMSSVQLLASPSRPTTRNEQFLAFSCEGGAALFQDSSPVLQVSENSFRPLAMCAVRRGPDGELAVLMLVSREPSPKARGSSKQLKESLVDCQRRVAWAFMSAQGKWRFVPLNGVRDDAITDVIVLNTVDGSLTALVLTSGEKVFRYAISLQNNDSHHRDVKYALMGRGKYVLSARAQELAVLVHVAVPSM